MALKTYSNIINTNTNLKKNNNTSSLYYIRTQNLSATKS